MLPGTWPTPPASESGHIASTANPARQSTSAPTLIALRLRVLHTRAPITANRSPLVPTEAPRHRTMEHVVDVAAEGYPQTPGHDGKLTRADAIVKRLPTQSRPLFFFRQVWVTFGQGALRHFATNAY